MMTQLYGIYYVLFLFGLTVAGLNIYALILLIKALKIYIKKNS